MCELNYMEIKGLRGERLSGELNPELLLSCPIAWQNCVGKWLLKSSPSAGLSPIRGIVPAEPVRRRTQRSRRATFYKEWGAEKSGGPEGACPLLQGRPVVHSTDCCEEPSLNWVDFIKRPILATSFIQ